VRYDLTELRRKGTALTINPSANSAFLAATRRTYGALRALCSNLPGDVREVALGHQALLIIAP
jgi:hypothetical protein